MHILVTDRLTCVRCGPRFGLILVADELENRRVISGVLGCANCREEYPVRGGFGDLRPPPRRPFRPEDVAGPDDPEASLRLAALLGVREGPGLLAIVGPSARNASRLAGMIPDIEVIAAHPDLREDPEENGVSRIAVGGRLPFASGSLRGIVLEGPGARVLLEEAVRSLAPGSRLTYLRSPEGLVDDLEGLGVDLVMDAEEAVVGVRK